MVIGVDFDNTIVCYDRLFYQLAVERGLVPASLSADKESVRNFLRARDQEDDWTELQGYAYGQRIDEAEPFPGVREFFTNCRHGGVPVFVISHNTRLPIRGPQWDLQQAARNWLASHGFHQPGGIGLPSERVFFEATRLEKLQRIVTQGCTHFVDDLPEFLQEPAFPDGVERILFDPRGRHTGRVPFWRMPSWELLCQCLSVKT